jgi:hypothetical protein
MNTFDELKQLTEAQLNAEPLKPDAEKINFQSKKGLNLVTEVPDRPTEEELQTSIAEIERVLALCRETPRELGSPTFLAALKVIGSDSRLVLEYRDKFKKVKPSSIPMMVFDNAVKQEDPQSESNGDESVASVLIALVTSQSELIYDPHDGQAYVSTSFDGVTRTLAIGSKDFTVGLSYLYYKSTQAAGGRGLSASELQIKQACFALAGMAQFEGTQARVNLRVAKHNGGYYIDLCDDRRRVIEVLPTGWRILDKSPVLFWQPKAMQSLPIPHVGGDVGLLWKYANIPEKDRPLILAWLLDCFRPDTPYPPLGLIGPQGSVKSSTTDKFKQITDNNTVNLRTKPKTVEDIFIGSANSHVLTFENVSHLTHSEQDALCTVSTGGGYATRTLFTDKDETVIEVKRPVIVNSIVNVITAQDLADRAISIECPRIETYREAAEVEPEWAYDKPSIMGGLLDLFVETLAILPTVRVANPGRMADYTRLGEAMRQAQGSPAGEFDALYKAHKSESVIAALEASPVGVAVRDLVDSHCDNSDTVFYGTVKTLYEKLSASVNRSEGWPRSPRGLSEALKRQYPALLALGIEVEHSTQREYTETGRGLTVKISKIGMLGTTDAKVNSFLSQKKVSGGNAADF